MSQPPPLSITTHSYEETLALGERIGACAQPGDVVALIGELGAGKTALTKGILRGLGGDPDDVTSPTFVLMLRHDARMPLYHFDAYRLSDGAEIAEIGAEEAFYGEGISVVEWADRVADVLPPDRLEARMSVAGETARDVSLTGSGPRGRQLAQAVVTR